MLAIFYLLKKEKVNFVVSCHTERYRSEKKKGGVGGGGVTGSTFEIKCIKERSRTFESFQYFKMILVYNGQ